VVDQYFRAICCLRGYSSVEMVAASVKLHDIMSHKTVIFIVQNVLRCGL